MYQFPEEMKKTFESSPLSFVYYQNIDGKAVPVLASDGFCRNTGIDRDRVLDWVRTGMFERMHPDDVGLISRVSDDFLNKKGPYNVIFRCRIGNSYLVIHGYGQWQTMPGGQDLAVIGYSNITETRGQMVSLSEAYDMFREDKFYSDPLTGLPNINYLNEFAAEKVDVILSENEEPGVIYADVCSMQSYNNHYGIKEGDKLLCLCAETLRKQFPKSLLVRGADDHFILIASLKNRQSIRESLEKANQTVIRNARGNTFGLRFGICPVAEFSDAKGALDHAKHALKRIENDMNRVCAFFSQTAEEQYWKNRYIIENFEKALRNSWIKVYYQAIVRTETGKITSFEALARWIDPERGVISPGEFIPVLRHYHQMYKLDLFILEQVCREIPIRRKNGLPLLPVSVNFSRQDFDHADIIGEMNALYDKYNLSAYVPKDHFIAEITEQDIAVGEEKFHSQLQAIRANGYRIGLDDFGSGYSSINMFSRYQFDLIKYDMDLLRHLDDNGGANRLILKELVLVAKKLGIHTLTEGVENEKQYQFLKEIGCELLQGFYFAKPESLDTILNRLRNGRKIKNLETGEEREEFARKWLEQEHLKASPRTEK